jgi:uncharacterized protein
MDSGIMTNSQKIFQRHVALKKDQMVPFLEQLEQEAPLLLDKHVEELEAEIWKETDCLACANCCRNMSPTFTAQDIKRIATHFRTTIQAFKEKWLYQDKRGYWMNRQQPCQFLHLQTNKCLIYAIRPADCAGFPHLTKKKTVEYLHVHKQNIRFCPATFKLVEKLMQLTDKAL